MIATKLCDGAHGCGRERPLEEFRMLSHGRRAAYCHACELAYDRKRHAAKTAPARAARAERRRELEAVGALAVRLRMDGYSWERLARVVCAPDWKSARGLAVVYGGYRAPRRCAGCGCDWDGRTVGCANCAARHRLRARTGAVA